MEEAEPSELDAHEFEDGTMWYFDVGTHEVNNTIVFEDNMICDVKPVTHSSSPPPKGGGTKLLKALKSCVLNVFGK
jgi:hypothetical protein